MADKESEGGISSSAFMPVCWNLRGHDEQASHRHVRWRFAHRFDIIIVTMAAQASGGSFRTLRPRCHHLAQDRKFADMIGIMIGDHQDFAQDCIAGSMR